MDVTEEIPSDVPVKLPHPSYTVIARLVLLDGGEEWRAATAVRWNPTHVMVKIKEHEAEEPIYVRLRSDDVQRIIRPPRSASSPP